MENGLDWIEGRGSDTREEAVLTDDLGVVYDVSMSTRRDRFCLRYFGYEAGLRIQTKVMDR